jgi:PIN domain nuclease of toxin-antitoxin system
VAILLLDTCALIWLVQDERLAPTAVQALRDARDRKIDVLLSPITAWEVGLLVERGRLKILISPHEWFARAIATTGVRLADMSAALLIESSCLPGRPPSDPGDRIIAATAREIGATLVTRDRLLLDYGAQGHLTVLRC